MLSAIETAKLDKLSQQIKFNTEEMKPVYEARNWEIYKLFCGGATYKEIADHLGFTENTIKKYVHAVEAMVEEQENPTISFGL